MKLKKLIAIMLSTSLALTVTACNTADNPNPADTGSSTGQDTVENTQGNNEKTEAVTDVQPGGTLAQVPEEAPPKNVPKLNDYSYADSVADSEYVIENGITDRMIALSELNFGNTVRLANVMKKAESGEEITVSFIGGSITEGMFATKESECYARLVHKWFSDTYPNATVNYNKAGIGNTDSYFGVHRVERDVLSNKPDVVFVEFSVNDATWKTRRCVDSYDSLLRKIWNSESKPAIVCIGMTHDSGDSFQNYHYDIAKSYDLPFISYRNAILDVIKNGHIKWSDISNDNVHPNTVGHSVLAEIITHYLNKVNSDKNNVSGEESDFSKAYTSDKYANAVILTPANIEAIDETGIFEVNVDKVWSNMKNGYWKAVVNNGFGGAKLVFKDVEAKNIGLSYGKIVNGGTILDVYIDGILAKTNDARFPDGWGDYSDIEPVVSFEKSEKHIIEIVPRDEENATTIYIGGLFVS